MSTGPAESFVPPPEGFADSDELLAAETGYPPDDSALTQAGYPTPLLDARAAIEDALRRQGELRSRVRTSEEQADALNIQGVGIGQASPYGSGRQPPGSPAIVIHLAYPRTTSQVLEILTDEMGIDAARSNDIDISTVVTGTFEPLATYMDKWRPAPGGVSTGHASLGGSGTLGCLAAGRTPPRNERTLILSNNHVLARSNNANLGDCVVQPGQGDGGICPDDQVAVLERMVPLTFGAGSINLVDAATAWAWPDRVHPQQLYIGTSGPVVYQVHNIPTAAFVGMVAGKSGRTTGFTIGTVEEVGVADWVGPYNTASGPAHAFFSGQIALKGNPLFSNAGDSGSLIWSNTLPRHPIGLLFAGGGTGARTLANNIQNVLLSLDILLLS